MNSTDRYPWLRSRNLRMPVVNVELYREYASTKRLNHTVRRMWRDVLRQLANPIRIESYIDLRVVFFMGTARCDVFPGNGGRVFRFQRIGYGSRRNGSTCCVWEPSGFHWDVIAPYHWDCLEHFHDKWQPLIVPWFHNYSESVCFLNDVFRAFRYELDKAVDYRKLSIEFGCALGLTDEFKRLGGELENDARSCSLESYNLVADHADWFRRYKRDLPRMLWLVSVLCNARIPIRFELEPIAAMREALGRFGIGPLVWRLLTKDRHARRRLQFYAREPRSPHAILYWLALHQQLRLPRLLPELFSGRFEDKVLPDGHDQIDFKGELDPLEDSNLTYPVMRVVAEKIFLLEKGGGLMMWFLFDWVRFVGWADHGNATLLDKNQIKVGWGAIWKKVLQWEVAVDRYAISSDVRWPYALDCVADERYQAVALNTRRSLWEEGDSMNHCIGGFGPVVGKGYYRIYSIRRRADNERLATLALFRSANDPRWLPVEARGYLNDTDVIDLNQRLTHFLVKVAMAYNDAEGLPRLEMNEGLSIVNAYDHGAIVRQANDEVMMPMVA